MAAALSAAPLFLGERVVLVPTVAESDPLALPTVVFRTDTDSRNFFIMADCDARNLVTLDREGAVFRMEWSFSVEENGVASTATFAVEGGNAPGDLSVTPAGGGSRLPSLEGWTATLEHREDGMWRITARIPLEKWGIEEGDAALFLQVRFLLATQDAGKPPEFGPGGSQSLFPGQEHGMDYRFRRITAADISEVVRDYGNSPDETCARRFQNRLFRLGSRDEALRGALVMAMEHEDAALRMAAARLWLWWPDDTLADLDAIREKAKHVMEALEASGPES